MWKRATRSVGSLALSWILVSGCGSGESSHSADPPIQSVARTSGAASAAHAGPAAGETGAGAKGPEEKGTVRTGPFEKTFEGIRFSVPAGWKEVELAPAQQGFIDARFQIPTPHGDVTLTCSSNAGGIDTNVRRWVGQFHPPAGKRPVIEEVDVGGRKATWVDLQGEFDAGPMAGAAGPASPIDRMLGVAIPLGARDFYLKLTGSDAAVSDVRTAFREFARDARPG
jgi:hypothetical protein